MLEVREATVVFNGGTVNEKTALDHVSLTLEAGDFATVIGSNGAGKSTLLSAIAGSLPLTSGQITLQGQDMTRMKEHRRSHAIGRLFQDPLKGTAPSMTIEENLGLAYSRGKRRSLQLGVSRKDERFFYDLLKSLNLGLEERMKTPAGHLSGGQRQAADAVDGDGRHAETAAFGRTHGGAGSAHSPGDHGPDAADYRTGSDHDADDHAQYRKRAGVWQ